MKIAVAAKELAVDGACAFVPTMGALHAGHTSLIKKAREYSDTVVVSIFINPLQFENKDDLAKYPRTPDFDIELAANAGATHLWLPNVQEIYPGEVQKISAGALGDIYEGVKRPGHFDGVLTVVNRLFELVKPTWAIFGEKDFQQLTLIKSMQSSVEIIAAPTIRDTDGLALSSRNVRLSDPSVALVIYRALIAASKEKNTDSARGLMKEILTSEEAFTLDYAEIINEINFEKAQQSDSNKRAIIAGWVNGIRLIDNMPMNGAAQ
ncbi:MAG: pantoate--beta-alanine ligase [Actinobacteria bacterium]|uniref:pantoate--beta-alanine ligase (AMP-forming) n=1 Tax=freshwater metagenome TaxID=449393 RepID=A0A6J6U8U2_9ZZZZ|nr:pantoate--beta-alanine ligase [Actinomycetota bacterium]